MQSYTYNWEVKDLLTQFLHAFDGAIIKRFDNARKAADNGGNVAVRYVYSPKQRVLFDLVDKAQHITLPAISFSIGSISRDSTRVFNKLEGSYYIDSADPSKNRHVLQPVPINIVVNISILTRFQTDMDQIISNFVPYSDPYFIISWTRDGLPDREIRTEVLWSGNLAMGYPTDLNANQPTRITCDTSFTIKGWVFKADTSPLGRIFKIDSNFYAVDTVPAAEGNDASLAKIQAALNGTPIETVTVSARPIIHYSDRWVATAGVTGTCTLLGDMFDKVNSVYLSGGGGMFANSTNTLTFSAFPSLNNKFPTLTGLSLPLNYTINSNNSITVTYPVPSLSAVGNYFNIIVVNEAGYSTLTYDTYVKDRPTQLPYALIGIHTVY